MTLSTTSIQECQTCQSVHPLLGMCPFPSQWPWNWSCIGIILSTYGTWLLFSWKAPPSPLNARDSCLGWLYFFPFPHLIHSSAAPLQNLRWTNPFLVFVDGWMDKQTYIDSWLSSISIHFNPWIIVMDDCNYCFLAQAFCLLGYIECHWLNDCDKFIFIVSLELW